MCRKPVGEGAKRVTTGLDMNGSRRLKKIGEGAALPAPGAPV
jgi:hypothetical protein